MASDGYKSLNVYKLAFDLAKQLFILTRNFPVEEKYSLTDQIRRSSRSICTNIAEAYRKRIYPKHFISKLTDADGECSETIVWLDFALDCKYIDNDNYEKIIKQYNEIGKMLGSMIENPLKFKPTGFKTNLQ